MLDSATIDIGQKTYLLRFSLNELARAEKLVGKPLTTIFIQKDQPVYEIRDLCIIFKCGLRAEYPKITDEEANELLESYLSEGESVAVQLTFLYLILGKATGFFRLDLDFRTEMEKVNNSMKKSKK